MKMLADKAYEKIPKLIQLLWTASATMLLALLFSFLISLDIARLSREIQSLGNSRLHDFYEQAAQPVVRFAYVVGRAFQARVAVASINTVLTTLGLLLLGVPSVAMLSLIVFLCSFIPVLGVFISMAPLVLVALNAGGLGKTAAVVGLVGGVHLVEAFVLKPDRLRQASQAQPGAGADDPVRRLQDVRPVGRAARRAGRLLLHP